MTVSHSKYILVTGGAGYIGSHTCKMLKSRGYEPVTFDNLSNGHKHAVKWGPLVEGDLKDIHAVRAVFDHYKFSAVIHFASFIEVGESVQTPEKYYANNVIGSLNLLNVMKEYQVHDLVFSSSCAVYGSPEIVPITEDTPQHPINPYGHSKMMVEQILQDFSVAHDLRYVSCRYFNACGSDPDLEIGEEHDPETHIIPIALMSAAGKRDSFKIYGTDYSTEDGTCVRDYIHVHDLANAHIAALEYLERGGQNDAFNLGTGRGYSVKQILEKVKEITGRSLHIEEQSRRPGDPPTLIAETKKVKTILNFQPEMSDLDTIIQTAWNFYCQRNTHSK